MKLKDRKIKCAQEILSLVRARGYVQRMGGEQQGLLNAIREMANGVDLPYDKGLNWLKIDSMPSDEVLGKKFSELRRIQHSLDRSLRCRWWNSRSTILEKKIGCAEDLLYYLKAYNLEDALGGVEGILLKAVAEMAAGKDRVFDKELVCLLTDKGQVSKELTDKFYKLKRADTLARRCSWLPRI